MITLEQWEGTKSRAAYAPRDRFERLTVAAVRDMFDSAKRPINGLANVISIAILSALAGVPEESRIPARF